MAIKGQIPGAAKLGHDWTFDVAKLRQWIADKEAANMRDAQWARTSTQWTPTSSRKLWPPRGSDLAYEQAMQRLLSGGKPKRK
jgi:hypothetical protein